MLTTPPHRRTLRLDVTLATSLAFVAGAANAIALRSCGVFAANMTGNVSLTLDRLASGQGRLALLFAAMVAAFVAGSMVCATVGHVGQQQSWHRIHQGRLLVEAAGMAALALATIAHDSPVWLLPGGLAFLMGWQNALATTVSAAKARSTHLSGIFTDIGIDVAEVAFSTGAVGGARERLLLGLATCAAFCVGAFAAAVSYGPLGNWVLTALAALLAVIAVAGARSQMPRRFKPLSTGRPRSRPHPRFRHPGR